MAVYYLHRLELQNFKRFGETGSEATLDLAPATFLYGPNSAGKSSLLQALLVLKQSWERLEDVRFLSTEGPEATLGSFENVVHRHDTSREMRFRLTLRDLHGDHRSPDGLSSSAVTATGAALSPSQSRVSDEELTCTLAFRAADYAGALVRIDLESGQDRISLVAPREEPHESDFPLSLRVVAYPTLQHRDIATLERARRRLAARDIPASLCEAVALLADAGLHLSAHLGGDSLSVRWSEYAPVVVEVDVEGDLVRQPVDDVLPPEVPTVAALTADQSAGESIRKRMDGFLRATLLRTRNLVRGVRHLGRERTTPARVVVRPSVPPRTIGQNGSHLTAVLAARPSLRERLNELLGDIDQRYRLEIDSTTADGSICRLFVVQIDPERPDGTPFARVGASDVGAGFSHLLPALALWLLGLDELEDGLTKATAYLPILCIEQPELHLHPSLQSVLGPLFAGLKPIGQSGPTGRPWAARGPTWIGPQVIVETHSEMVVLALAQQVGRGVLDPRDVAFGVLHEAHDGSARIGRPRLARDGVFDQDEAWPNGFFPERLELSW